MKTHGEQWHANKLEIESSHGFEFSNPDRGLPPKMEYKKAVIYYNTKLFKYWVDKLDSKLTYERKAQVVSALMFGHTETYKQHKELLCNLNQFSH